MCPDAKEIMAVVGYIHSLRCSLNTLRIAFSLHEIPTFGLNIGYSELYRKDGASLAACTVATSASLIDAVSNLQVENKIDIVIESNDHRCLFLLEDFAAQIGSKKQWASTLQRATRDEKAGTECSEEEKVDADTGNEAADSSSDEEDDELGHFGACDSCDSCKSVYSETRSPSQTWTWTLTPATEATKGSIPEIDRS